MTKPLHDIKSASDILCKVLKTVNESHLANFSRKTVPENELVKHVHKRLRERLGDANVFKSIKGRHVGYGKVIFLYQPDVDLAFRYNNLLHGVEFKLMRRDLRFYSGLEEAIAYSTYGVDFSWIVHFFRKNFKKAKSYEKWMEFIIKRSGCPSVGYITSTTQGPKVVAYPTEPFRSRKDRDLGKMVSKIRKERFA